MKKNLAFKIIKDLCGDSIDVLSKKPPLLYMDAGFRAINASVDILGFLLEKQNTQKTITAAQEKLEEEVKTYKAELQKKTRKCGGTIRGREIGLMSNSYRIRR